MANDGSIFPLRKVLSLLPSDGAKGKSLSLADLKKIIKIMIEEDITVVCVNQSVGKQRTMPFKAMYNNNKNFWMQDGAWDFFLSIDDLNIVREEAGFNPDIWELVITQPDDEKADNAGVEPVKPLAVQGYGREYEDILAMTDAQKVQKINVDKKRLDTLLAKKHPEHEVVTEALVDITKNAAMINHAVLANALQHADYEAKELTHDLVDSTYDMVKSSVNLISEDIFNDDMMNTLVEKSNGTIVQHMTRVYLNGISFMAYYNRLVSTSSAINKLRISFTSRYRKFYSELLPHLPREDVHLENVFYKGMRAIPLDFFYRWAVGFLVHDIGKAAAVEYHEGTEAYNRDIVIEHVKVGYASVMNKTNYPREAGLITGFHHEYYGDNSGYGYFRVFLDQYKKKNPGTRQDHCIAYELEPLLDFRTYAYFPAKILEIIDIYDSVTDPNRKYHKAMTPEETINMMREEFVQKHHKIDALLFDIFAAFVLDKSNK